MTAPTPPSGDRARLAAAAERLRDETLRWRAAHNYLSMHDDHVQRVQRDVEFRLAVADWLYAAAGERGRVSPDALNVATILLDGPREEHHGRL